MIWDWNDVERTAPANIQGHFKQTSNLPCDSWSFKMFEVFFYPFLVETEKDRNIWECQVHHWVKTHRQQSLIDSLCKNYTCFNSVKVESTRIIGTPICYGIEHFRYLECTVVDTYVYIYIINYMYILCIICILVTITFISKSSNQEHLSVSSRPTSISTAANWDKAPWLDTWLWK